MLDLPAVRAGAPVVRAGTDRLQRPVRWVHVSEVPWIASLLEGGELILTTGIALPRARRDLSRYVDELAAIGVCGVVVELGRRYAELPAGLVEAAENAQLPLIELHRETRFVAITQEVHTRILDARMAELVAADERYAHRTLLTLLAAGSLSGQDAAERAGALGVPLAERRLTAIAAVPRSPRADEVMLRESAGRAAEVLRSLRVPALVGVVDDRRVSVLLSQTPATGLERVDSVVGRLAEQLHAVAARYGDDVVVAAGGGIRDPTGVRAALAEAARVADAAVVQPGSREWYRASDLRLPGLAHALGDVAPLRDFVERELGALVEHDRARGTALLDVLAAYCRAGGNKTVAAAALFVSRPALYERIARVEKVLDVDLAEPETVLSLHFAIVARDAIGRPDRPR